MSARERHAWLFAGVLLLVAGVLTAVSYVEHWWPCFDGGMRSELCLRRRDSWLVPPYMSDPPDRVPGVTGPVAVAALLAGLAWPVAMRAVPLPRAGRVVGVLLAVQTVSVGVWSVVSAFTPLIDPELPVPLLWHVGGELLAVALGTVLVYRSVDEEKVPWHLVWPLLVLVGATTFGFVRWAGELLLFHGHLGDGYPRRGAGLGLAATLLVCGAALVLHSVALEARTQRRPVEEDAEPGVTTRASPAVPAD